MLEILEKEGKTEHVFSLFQKSLKALAALQVKGHEGLDYQKCLTSKIFGNQSIMTDLLYYKYYFLDSLQYPYDKQALMNEFELLSEQLASKDFNYFLFRDFQSRNIMVHDDEVYFIDFQGGIVAPTRIYLSSIVLIVAWAVLRVATMHLISFCCAGM